MLPYSKFNDKKDKNKKAPDLRGLGFYYHTFKLYNLEVVTGKLS